MVDFLKENGGLLAAYPFWYQLLLMAWLIAAAVLIAGYLLISPITKKTENGASQNKLHEKIVDTLKNKSAELEAKSGSAEHGNVILNKQVEASSFSPDGTNTLTFAQFFSQANSLDGRFAEKDHFEKSVVGKKLTGELKVTSVSARDDGGAVLLGKAAPKFVETVGARFPPAYKTRLFALRRGDKVYIEGIITGALLLNPYLDGTKLEVLGNSAEKAPK